MSTSSSTLNIVNQKEYLKNVCIVGNAESLWGKSLGATIDSYDIVVRLNYCYTINLEEHTGYKTTHWMINRSFASDINFILSFYKPRLVELLQDGLKNILIRSEGDDQKIDPVIRSYMMGIFNEYAHSNNLELTYLDGKKYANSFFPNENFRKHPTTGLSAICYFLQRYRTVDIVGFGASTGEVQSKHYWPRDSYIDFKYHNLPREIQLINQLPVRRLDE